MVALKPKYLPTLNYSEIELVWVREQIPTSLVAVAKYKDIPTVSLQTLFLAPWHPSGAEFLCALEKRL